MAALKKIALTDRGLASEKAAEKGQRRIVWDAACPYLGVSITDKGAKSFIVVKRMPGAKNPHKHVIGRYPRISLKEARARTPAILAMLADGRNPRDEAKRRATEQERQKNDTFALAVEKFVERCRDDKKLRSWREIEAILRREFLGQEPKRERVTVKRGSEVVQEWVTEWSNTKMPIWRDRPVRGIARRDVIERLEEIKRTKRQDGKKLRGGKHAARHALVAVRSLFNWLEKGERFGITISPAARISDSDLDIHGSKDLVRRRTLSDVELRDVWQAAGSLGYPFGPVVQLLMLNGQRLNDVVTARREELEQVTDMLVVPPERYKTDIKQEVPITPRAAAIFASLPKFDGPYLFTKSFGSRPIGDLSKLKEKIDAAIAQRRAETDTGDMPSWVLHDLRRTVRTRLTSDLGVNEHIAERVIGHAVGGIRRHYDHGTYRHEKRAALEKWEKLLLSIVEPEAVMPNVVGVDEVARRRSGRRSA